MILDGALQDIRYGIRAMRRGPAFTLAVVSALSLGIGANTAVFSVANGILLRPLPYASPDRLVWIHDGLTQHDPQGWSACVADYMLWRDRSTVIESLAAFGTNGYVLTGGGEAEVVRGAAVTARFFDTLGVRPLIGRTFAADADKPGQEPTALISERLWRRRFAGHPDVLGKSIVLNSSPVTVIGVMPSSFQFRNREADIWRIFPLDPPTRRGPFFLRGLARLKPGVTMDQVNAEMDALGREVEAADTKRLEHVRYPVTALRDSIVGDVSRLVWVLAGAVALVQLIVVFNVANLLLARAAARQREMAIRISVGAGSGRLLGQLITESLLLAAAGGAIGV